MIDPSAQSLHGYPAPRLARPERPPGVVYAAAVVTWIGAAVTTGMTLLITAWLLLFLAPVFAAFEGGTDNPRWFVAGAAAVVVTLSGAAAVVAVFMLRGHRWAQWVLVALSMVAAAGGAMWAYYIAPLAVTAAAVAVIVLLLLPDARAWFRAAHSPH